MLEPRLRCSQSLAAKGCEKTLRACMQMFLEYQNISGNGLRRMMDAPIVATVKCQTSTGGKQQAGKQQTKTLTREVCAPPPRNTNATGLRH